MDSQTVMIALFAGFLIYAIIEIDKRYLSPREESKNYSSLRIASLMSLLVYGVVSYFKCNIACEKNILGVKSPSSPLSVNRQQIMTEPF